MIPSRVRPLRPAAAAVLLAVLTGAGAAQDDEFEPDERPMRPTRRITRMLPGDAVVLDARLDEPLWERALQLGPLVQTLPSEGVPMTVDTDVLLTYDDRSVYVGLRCYDDPEEVRARQMERDAFVQYDDVVQLWFDPFDSGRFAYWFQVTPGGSLGDALIADNGSSFNKDWDGIWYGDVRVTDDGWHAELEFPFQTMSFDPEAAAWGFNVTRERVANGEQGRWASPRTAFGFFQVSDGGRLVGIEGVDQGVGLDVKPYLKLLAGRADSARSFGTEWDTGLDVRWRPTPTATLLVTTNTDFAETEVDARRINIGRFPLFFPEKRDFFLEDAGAFEFGAPRNRRSLIPFFSRTIGRDDAGAAVPILAGVKGSGRFGPWTVGLLDTYVDEIAARPVTPDDDGAAAVDAQNLGVLRLSRSLGAGGSIGAIVTSGDPRGDSGRTTFGIDGRLGSSDLLGDGHSGFLWAYLLGTAGAEGDAGSGAAYGVEAQTRSNAWQTSFLAQRVERGFDPALGFVRRSAVDSVFADVEHTWRFDENDGALVRTIESGFGARADFDLDGREDTWTVPLDPFEVQLWSQDSIGLRVWRRAETIEEAFDIGDGAVVAPGEYDETRARVEFESNDRRLVGLETSFERGDYYGGDIERLRFEPVLIPNEHVVVGASFEDVAIDLGGDGRLHTQLYSLRFDLLFDPFTSWKSFVQYDTESKDLSLQSRIRWIVEPGQELFLVGLFGFEKEDSRSSFVSGEQSLAVKLALTFRF